MDIYLLALITLFTSTFAAIMGQGGGLMLMGVLAGSVPTSSLIAVHGIIQASSNGSRAVIAKKHIHWPILVPIALGILLGAVFIVPLIPVLNWQWMQGVIAFYILWLTWGHLLPKQGWNLLKTKSSQALFKLGLLQGGLGMALGATGPLGNALLLNMGLKKEAIIATNALVMFLSHLVKVIFFSAMGVQLIQHTQLLIWLSVAAIAGSYLGSFFRQRLPESIFLPLFKAVLTLLAIRMLILAFP